GAVSSSMSSVLAAPYRLQDDENKNRFTPASLASSPRRTLEFRLIAYVHSGFRSPTGSFDNAARWITASKPSRSLTVRSRTSLRRVGTRFAGWPNQQYR